jgi:hypothetical protein
VLPEEFELYLQERKRLEEASRETTAHIDKSIVVICDGGIALSVTLLPSLGVDAWWLAIALLASWVSLVGAILCCFFSNRGSVSVYTVLLQELDKHATLHKADSRSHPTIHDAAFRDVAENHRGLANRIRRYNVWAQSLMVVGVASLLVYASVATWSKNMNTPAPLPPSQQPPQPGGPAPAPRPGETYDVRRINAGHVPALPPVSPAPPVPSGQPQPPKSAPSRSPGGSPIGQPNEPKSPPKQP